ncbi:MAG: phosphoenolpyruvate--protein phosphotransferase [Pseudomonadota bacterium]
MKQKSVKRIGMLQILRRIVQKISLCESLNDVLNIIVNNVKKAIDADVCSIYLQSDDKTDFVLMATNGLNPKGVGKILIPPGEGLVSLVAEKGDPVNIANALEHPRFKLFEYLDEVQYHGFSGIPIISHKKVLGVLVVQSIEHKAFTADEVNFLLTIAAQLSTAILHAQAVEYLPAMHKDNRPLMGLPGAPGVAVGQAIIIASSQNLSSIPDRPVSDTDKELALFSRALKNVKDEIKVLSKKLSKEKLPSEDVAIFDAYLLMLDSKSFFESTENHILEGNWAAGALRKTIEEHINLFSEMDNHYLQERMKDISDLGQTILDQMLGNAEEAPELIKNSILIAEDFSVMALSKLDSSQVKGIVSAKGSRTSHIAILARAMGIPTVMGVTELPFRQLGGCQVIVDGYSGKVFLSPPASIRKEYMRLVLQEDELAESLDLLKDKQAITTDGYAIPLYVNMGLEEGISSSKSTGAEGIGLFRTEYPFMISQQFPGEKDQSKIYKTVLKSYAPKPVVLRTLDIGGDKALSYFPIEEENPFLGWRGIRISLDHPEIFIIQLRAMLIANIDTLNLHILVPMISTIEEIEESKILLSRAYYELLEEGYQVSMPQFGVMIEVPSLIFQIRQISKIVDFISIGTNDLIQYLLAVDRNNPQVAQIYESMHPGVVQALNKIINDAHLEKVPVSVCGEMASDPMACLLLLGMGIDILSTNVASLPRIKWVIREYSRVEAKEILAHVLTLDSTKTIRQYLSEKIEEKGLGGLIRVGK